MKGKFLTDRGQIRSYNEDAGGIYYNISNQFLAIIADGMGGHQAGDVASQMATEITQKHWESNARCHTPQEAEDWLRQTITELNTSIYQHATENEACHGMGTTVVISICTDEFMTIAHIGDSRCYMLDKNGFKQITEDHSLVSELVRTGQVSEEDAKHHPRKNVLLKALGTEEDVTADIRSMSWEKEDKLLLCSDGLTDKLADRELASFLQSGDNQEAGEKMITLANERGGEDNISLIIAENNASAEEGETTC